MRPMNFLQDLLAEEGNRSSEVQECSQMIMSDLQVSRKLPDIVRAFGQLKTNPQKINFAQEILKKYNLAPYYVNPNKNEQESNRLREVGNMTFKEKRLFSTSKTSLYEQAAREYTKSITYAPKDSQCLAMGYANRSAALFHLKLYKECVEDIDRAYEHYPLDLKSKILDRRNKALSLMSNRIVLKYHTPTPEILQINKNESIDCASNAIKIQKTADACQIVATRDIKAGELLVVEKALLSNLISNIKSPSSFILHCSICLNLCYNLIPCDDCNQELFCSESCKSRSRDIPYKYLCGMRGTLDCAHNHSNQLALLLALKIVCDQSPNNGSDANGSKNLECLSSNRLNEILNLPTGEDKMSLTYQFVLALEAGTVFQLLLTYSSEFRESNVNVNTEVFKDQLLRSFYICSQYFRPINKALEVTTSKYMNVENIGRALYSFSSLLRHSCVSNTHSITYGTTRAIFAAEKIKKNDEVFSQHPDISATKLSPIDRKFYLNMIRGYTCNCAACVEEWPTEAIFFPIDHKMKSRAQLISSELRHRMAELLREHTLGKPIGKFVIGNGFNFDKFKSLKEKAVSAANEAVKKPSVEYFEINFCSLFLLSLMGNTHFKLLH